MENKFERLYAYLVHSTHPDNLKDIFADGKLYSFNRLEYLDKVVRPSSFRGKIDTYEMGNYIEFAPPTILAGELVANSRWGLNIQSNYQPSSRLFFNKTKLEEHPNVEINDISLKIKGELELLGFLEWVIFPGKTYYETSLQVAKENNLKKVIEERGVIIDPNSCKTADEYISTSNAEVLRILNY